LYFAKKHGLIPKGETEMGIEYTHTANPTSANPGYNPPHHRVSVKNICIKPILCQSWVPDAMMQTPLGWLHASIVLDNKNISCRWFPYWSPKRFRKEASGRCIRRVHVIVSVTSQELIAHDLLQTNVPPPFFHPKISFLRQ